MGYCGKFSVVREVAQGAERRDGVRMERNLGFDKQNRLKIGQFFKSNMLYVLKRGLIGSSVIGTWVPSYELVPLQTPCHLINHALVIQIFKSR